MKTLTSFLAAGIVWLLTSEGIADVIPLNTADAIRLSTVVCRGTVVGQSCFRNAAGRICTATSLRVDEALSGVFPAIVKVVHPGGELDGEDEFHGFSPRFQPGTEYLLYLERGPDGTLHCLQGPASAIPLNEPNENLLAEVRDLCRSQPSPGADVTDQIGSTAKSITGMLGGVSSRFLEPDRGQPIGYVIDADSYPAALTLGQATNAVLQALDAWTAVTSLKFRFDGFESFGQAANTLTNDDDRLYIQLHDAYNAITSATTLGIGGRSARYNPLAGAGWDLGGNVAGNEFRRSTRGYVVLESTSSSMQNPLTFAEVLCHEIGHSLNMAHSSEVVTSDANLTNAIMYFRAHADGRGATLGAYDVPVIQQVYPFNTVPYGYNRFLDAVTAPSTPAVAGINQVEMRGYDLQTTNLTIEYTNSSSLNGSLSVSGNVISYTPAGYYSYNGRLDPTDTKYKDRMYVRFSDGTNASPYVLMRVLSLDPDSNNPSDGLPDRWMSLYFGHTSPSAGDKSRATDDADGDGLNNLQEYIAGSNPTDAGSAQRLLSLSNGVLQFQAKAFELYEILGSTNLRDWSLVGDPVQPTDAPPEVLTNTLGTNIIVTVSNLTSGSSKMFFRVRKVP